MSSNGQSPFFPPLKTDQRGARLEHAEIDQPKAAGHEIGNTGNESRHQAQLRPHLWPLPFSVLPREMCCLVCGAPFDGRQAEGPCRLDQQNYADANCAPAALAFNPLYFRRRAKRIRKLLQTTLRHELRKALLDPSSDYAEVAVELDQRGIRVRHPNRHNRAHRSSLGRRYGAL